MFVERRGTFPNNEAPQRVAGDRIGEVSGVSAVNKNSGERVGKDFCFMGARRVASMRGTHMRHRFIATGAIALLLGLASQAHADAVTFTGTSGDLSASATFTLTGTTLTIALTNTSSVVVANNPQLLTGVFWNSPTSVGGSFDATCERLNPFS